MSLKDELEKKILEEKNKLDQERADIDQEKMAFRERQRDRFQSIRPLLEELVAAIEKQPEESKREILRYLDNEVGAIIILWIRLVNMDWTIQPNYEIVSPLFSPEQRYYEERPGFRVKEIDHEEQDDNVDLEFETKEEAIQYLVGAIAKKIAYIQHKMEKRTKK